MRIGLNATVFNDRPSGARQRFVGIYGALVRRRPDWTFVVYEPADYRVADWFEGAPNVVARRTPITSAGRLQRVARGARYWRGAFAADRLDRFEDFVLPMVRHPSAPTVLTIHDIRSLHERAGIVGGAMRRWVYRRALASATRVLAVSDAVRDEILAFHPAAKVTTVYNGVDPSGFAAVPAAEVAAVRDRYRLPERYILAVGHLEARKNLPLLVAAVARLRDAGSPRALAIVGNDGGDRAAVVAQVEALGLGDLVTMIAHADDTAVRALYAGAHLLAFPSRYEGFGIPILEAMAADLPMVLADTPVFRELTLGEGAYFPVDDPDAAAAAIARVWDDPAERDRQHRLGAARLADFGFDRLADQVAAIHEALGRPGT